MKFAVGYAPDAWDAVLKRFGGSAERDRALAEAGLVIERSGKGESGYYDRFRDRVMFPIRDARGRPIAFGGRILDKGEPKYLNSPETPLFHKGRELYGLYEARQALRKVERLLVVEGYVDVVRLAQSGIAYSVATLGTATTPEHLNRLFRVTSELVFCFDGDNAGRNAAWRALENALEHARDGRQLRFLFLPEGHDPDTLVGEEGAEAFEARIAERPADLRIPRHAARRAHGPRERRRPRAARRTRPPAARAGAGGRLSRTPDGAPRAGSAHAGGPARGSPQGAPDRGRGITAGRGERPARGARPAALRGPPAAPDAGDHAAAAPSRRRARSRDDTAPGSRASRRVLRSCASCLKWRAAEPKLTTAQFVERWRDRPEGAGSRNSPARSRSSRMPGRPGGNSPPCSSGSARNLGPKSDSMS